VRRAMGDGGGRRGASCSAWSGQSGGRRGMWGSGGTFLAKTLIVGVLNVTPDSFSDGGRFESAVQAVDAGLALLGEGASWIDVGGESTRPGATPVSEEEEKARIIPVIEQLAAHVGDRARISVDTQKSGTARAALAAGASIVNDISGGVMDPRILRVVADAGATIILGHMRGVPATMMDGVWFGDVVVEVGEELASRVDAAQVAGCKDIWADPGIGFGKRLPHNLRLLRELPALIDRLGLPLMVGVSRKHFLGEITGRPPRERAFATAAAVAAAVVGGASAVRVHDVAAMRDVVAVTEAIAAGSPDRA
jgi:dihydropteroate synthase